MQRLLRFRLRTIFLITAGVACFLAWRLRDPERAAVEAIEQAGGKVHFAYQGPMPANAPNSSPTSASTPRELLPPAGNWPNGVKV